MHRHTDTITDRPPENIISDILIGGKGINIYSNLYNPPTLRHSRNTTSTKLQRHHMSTYFVVLSTSSVQWG